MKEKKIFSHILVPVDGSHLSHTAQELAALIAKKFNSKVTALHVVTHELMHPELARFHAETREYVTEGSPRTYQGEPWVHIPEVPVAPVAMDISNLYRQKGEEVIAEASTLFKEEGIPVDQKLIEHADPTEAIIKEAREGKCDLIVMARSAGEEETKPHLGSVARKVSLQAQTPVLIAAEGSQISKILAPVDGSKPSRKAAEYAAILAKKTEAAMTLLYVQESSLFRLRPELTKTIGSNILSSFAKRVEGVKVDQKLESGDPGWVINQTADRQGYDIIVMGDKGHSGIRRLILGSVSDHVIHYSNHAVLLVK